MLHVHHDEIDAGCLDDLRYAPSAEFKYHVPDRDSAFSHYLFHAIGFHILAISRLDTAAQRSPKACSLAWKPDRPATSLLTVYFGTSPRRIVKMFWQAPMPLPRYRSSVQAMACGARMTLSSPVSG